MWGCCFQAGLHRIFFLSVVDYRLSGLVFFCRVLGLVVGYSYLSLFVGCRLSSILTIGCRGDAICGCLWCVDCRVLIGGCRCRLSSLTVFVPASHFLD
jgi:hypothetical protein